MKRKSILIVVAILSILLVGAIAMNSIKSDKNSDSEYSQINPSSESSSNGELSSNTDSSSKVEENSSIEDNSSEVEESSSDTDSSSIDDTEIAQTMATFSNLSHYKQSHVDRYIEYKKSNEDMSYEKCILNVNIGLDRQFYTHIYSAKNPTAIDVLVNKYSALDEDYIPSDLVNIPAEFDNRGGTSQLRQIAKDAFVKLCTDAKEDGYTIKGQSAYRSGSYQKTLYNNYVAADGKVAADTYSARSGHSEHQTGLAIDVIGSQYGTIGNFYKEKEYPYVKENAHKYGFIIRYPEGKTHITGYKSEPWHLRYVGVDIATQIYKEQITFDEYYALYK